MSGLFKGIISMKKIEVKIIYFYDYNEYLFILYITLVMSENPPSCNSCHELVLNYIDSYNYLKEKKQLEKCATSISKNPFKELCKLSLLSPRVTLPNEYRDSTNGREYNCGDWMCKNKTLIEDTFADKLKPFGVPRSTVQLKFKESKYYGMRSEELHFEYPNGEYDDIFRKEYF